MINTTIAYVIMGVSVVLLIAGLTMLVIGNSRPEDKTPSLFDTDTMRRQNKFLSRWREDD